MSDAIIFKNIDIITPDETGVQFLSGMNVAVINKKYAYVGDNLIKAKESLKTGEYSIYDGTGKILMPCFVNAHTHLAMTLMRNKADNETLHDWLYNTIFPLEAKLRPEDLNAGTELAIAEMIRSGTGACANMYMVSEGAYDADTAGNSGIKLNTVINGGFKNKASGKYQMNEDYFDELFSRFNDSYDGLIKCGVLCHSIYLYDKDYLENLAYLAYSRNTFIHLHLAETEKEVMDSLGKYKMRPPEALSKFGIFDVPVLAAHCIYLNEEDISVLSKNPNVTAIHNPASNMKLGSGMADISAILNANINLAIGTDGAASNNDLDMTSEMRLAGYTAKVLHKDASVISASEIIRMATINGMKGLGFENSGMVREGFYADLNIINTDNPNMTPLGDPLSAICYSSHPNDIESVMVNGRMLMKKRELLTIDEEKAKFNAKKSSEYLYK